MQTPDHYFELPAVPPVVYQPGDKIAALSQRSSLNSDQVYTVVRYVPPIPEYPDEPGVIFLEGQQYGVTTENIRHATVVIEYCQKSFEPDRAAVLAAQL